MASTFIARRRSTCTKCEDDIWPGQEAVYAAFGEIIHVNCPEQTKPAGETCDRCWTELPASGVCGVCQYD